MRVDYFLKRDLVLNTIITNLAPTKLVFNQRLIVILKNDVNKNEFRF